MTEELALQQGLRDGGAIQGDERAVRPGAVVVNDPGDQTFAGAAFTANEHRRMAGCNTGHQGKDLIHFPALGDQPFESVFFLEGLPECFIFSGEVDLVFDPLKEDKQLVQVNGFGQVIVSSEFHGLHRLFYGSVGGDQDHPGLGREGFDFPEQSGPIHARHLVVGEDDFAAVLL